MLHKHEGLTMACRSSLFKFVPELTTVDSWVACMGLSRTFIQAYVRYLGGELHSQFGNRTVVALDAAGAIVSINSSSFFKGILGPLWDPRTS